MTCYACHTSWMTSCFGCHLPQEQNVEAAMQHYEGDDTRNYASYNPQVIRTDTFMLGVNGTTKGTVSRRCARRRALVHQLDQRAAAAHLHPAAADLRAGYSSQAFNTHVPHTVRARETQAVQQLPRHRRQNDNNAWMAQLLMQGTNFVNFIGRYRVGRRREATDSKAIAVTEWDEPQAVIGSSLHKIVYPDYYAKHQASEQELRDRASTITADDARAAAARRVPLRRERRGGFERLRRRQHRQQGLLRAHRQRAGLAARPAHVRQDKVRHGGRAADDDADRSEPQDAVHPGEPRAADPSAVPLRLRRRPRRGTDPRRRRPRLPTAIRSNNFLTRARHVQSRRRRSTARDRIYVAGRWLFIGASKRPGHRRPRQAARSRASWPRFAESTRRHRRSPCSSATPSSPTRDGLHDDRHHRSRHPRIAGRVPIADARNVYVARTYAYVAGGKRRAWSSSTSSVPRSRSIDQEFDEGLHDAHDVKVASTNASDLRLRRRRQARPQDPAAHLARMDARLRRLQPASGAAAHRHDATRTAPRWRSRRGSTATAPSTRAATRSRSSTASAPAR